ncbi:unnamed protein product [Triticum turgidum subsp. durum]|uniref:Caleosin n=1 Tax=Triticum turgidum subsp. durum TaxID=4567 RepID=A0A9R1BL90_TRITD|nr:unnamed protein product [Triticum turgidum subsp. durum]
MGVTQTCTIPTEGTTLYSSYDYDDSNLAYHTMCIPGNVSGAPEQLVLPVHRFVPEKFEEIFKKHAHTRPDALTSKELGEMLKANRDPKDFKGRVGAFGEWRLLYALCKDKEGFLHKETMKAVYDGRVFEKLEREKKEAKEFAKKK